MNKNIFKEKLNPFTEFLHNEAIGGIILLVVTILAIILSNLSTASFFSEIWRSEINIKFGGLDFGFSLLHAINDGLMVLFFFVVGLEIKRELLVGELSSLKKALLPMIGAVGGMLVPAIIYLIFNSGGKGSAGWAIPVATDIAFVVGILVLLKNSIPSSLRVFLTALAIVDDIGAVVIIAVFYTASISLPALMVAFLFIFLLVFVNVLGVKKLSVYIFLGVGLWFAFLQSGIHTTIAGVILAFTIPSKSKLDHSSFLKSTKKLVTEIGSSMLPSTAKEKAEERLAIIQALGKNCQDAITPLQRFEINLHPWVTFFIIPLFALANAGVTVGNNIGEFLLDPVCLGIILGLFLGKQLGIFLFSYLAIKLKLSESPLDTSTKQLYGASVLAGIGFTMSLFIAGLSFPYDAGLIDSARIGILIASVLSGCVGYVLLRQRQSIKD